MTSLPKEKLRILHICHEPPDLILGGMGRHVRELLRFMSRRDDVQIDLLTSGAGEGAKLYNGHVYHDSDKHVLWKPEQADISSLMLSDMQVMKTFARLLHDGCSWDLVHGHEWVTMQIGWLARHALRCPLVYTMHLCMTELGTGAGSQDKGEVASEPVDAMTRYCFNNEARMFESDRVIVCSKAYERIAHRHFGPRPLDLIYNGIDLEVWNPERGVHGRAMKKHGLGSRPIALFVGRIAEMKGVETILDLIEEVDTGWQVVMAGEVNANSEAARESWGVTRRLRALEAAHPERLRWLGFQADQDLKDLYAAATVGLMPSLHEPFGLASLEHMAMGNPLICTDVDGLGEVVIDDSGAEYAMIVQRDDPADLREAFRILEDPEPRRELRGLGFRRAGAFDWAVVADQTVAVYREALAAQEVHRARRAQQSDRAPGGGQGQDHGLQGRGQRRALV